MKRLVIAFSLAAAALSGCAQMQQLAERIRGLEEGIRASQGRAASSKRSGLQGEYMAALYPLARATELKPETASFQNNLGVALERAGYVTHAADA